MRTFARRRTQVVREQSAKLRCSGSNPLGASNFSPVHSFLSRASGEITAELQAPPVERVGYARGERVHAWLSGWAQIDWVFGRC